MSGCAAYRLFFPLLELQRRGEIKLLCSIAYHAPDGQTRLQPVGNLPFDVIEKASGYGQFALSDEDIETADVVVLQKSGGLKTGAENESGLLETVERLGRRKFVYEVDDDLESITKLNPCYIEELQHNPGFIARMRALASRCRLVTCTTSYLANRMTKINPEVRVVPNGVDLDAWRPEGWTRPTADGRRLRCGWLASRNHVEDAQLLVRPLKRIAAKFPDVTFVLGGGFFPCLKDALGDRLEYHGGVSMTEYPAFARSLRLDIGLAPLADSVFARSKSALRWIEYTAMGIPTVASDVEPYRQAIGLVDRAGWLVNSTGDWIEALAHAITDASARVAAVDASDQLVRKWYTVQFAADRWLEVIREVVS
jgi:glycosyltransferase involved in cell wall biosynthesis